MPQRLLHTSRTTGIRAWKLALLCVALLAIGCAPFGSTVGAASAATANAAAAEPLVVSAALRLDRASIGAGGTITGTVSYRNATAAPVAIRNLVIAARSSTGEHGDFAPGTGARTIPAGGTVQLTATRQITASVAPGAWYAFSSWQDSLGVWHPAPTSLHVAFAVIAPALSGSNAIYWGAYIKGAPWDPTLIDAFEARVGKKSSIVHWGQPWWHDGAYQPFQTGLYERVRQRGAIPLIDWGSWDFCCGTNQPDFQLADIIAGRHDAYIRRWAAGARDWGHPFFLRFDWEMNGNWQFPWGEQVNGNRPGEYVRAWRHVHDLFAEVGATNVTWVWCVNVLDFPSPPIAALYPGDEYVDWVAMDGYNWGTDRDRRWRSFAEVFDSTYAALGQLAPGKPIMIAEFGSSEDGGSKADWIRDTFQTQLPARYPKVKAAVWFNWNDDDPSLDWPIESSRASIDAIRQSVGGSSYYAANRYGNLTVTPIPIPAAVPIAATPVAAPLATAPRGSAPAAPGQPQGAAAPIAVPGAQTTRSRRRRS